VAKPRLPGFDTSSNLGAKRRISRQLSTSFVALLIVLLCGGAALFLWAEEIIRFPTKQKTVLPQKVAYPVPTHISWTMDLTNAALPEETVVGSLHGSGFVCERAILRGGTLSLRQGKTWPPDLGITVVLPAPQGELLSGKTILVGPRRPPPVPK